MIVVITAINATGFTLNAFARLWDGSFPALPGYEDAVTLLVGVAALAMFPYCQLQAGHAVVDVFMQSAPQWLNKSIALLSNILTILTALFFSYMLIHGVIQMHSDSIETTVLGWPVWPFAATAIFSCVLWAIASLLQIFGAEDGT